MPSSRTQGDRTKVVLVTGSSTGIGRLTAQTAARAGHRVYASMREMEGRNREKGAELEELAREKSLALSCLELDVTDEGSVERAVQRILSEERRIDVVVNNAGHMAIGLTECRWA